MTQIPKQDTVTSCQIFTQGWGFFSFLSNEMLAWWAGNFVKEEGRRENKFVLVDVTKIGNRRF
jgi:hypothetical protein